jgi:tetratricopeptide (TPR) repeat protein
VSNLVDLRSHGRYKPDVMSLACGRVTAAQARLGLTDEEFAEELSSLLSWEPSASIIRSWKSATVAPPGDVLAACDILSPPGLVMNADEIHPGNGTLPRTLFDAMTSHVWTRDDSHVLSVAFDQALSGGIVDEIERLAHVWLISEPPQSIELAHGRRVSDSLIETVEHRVIQIRRADDFITGQTSHELVKAELHATTDLLADAELTDAQARRLLTAVGELAQLGAWIAADAGLLDEAARYVQGGVLAARAAGDAPLAANVLSTYSYQIANNDNPHDAVILARTAYQGGKRNATPLARALLLERVAWASAKVNDTHSCERALGEVDKAFSEGPRDNDPDWLYWLNREEVEVMAGRCYTELHKPDRAVTMLTSAIGNYDQALIRENALYLSWLAEDYVQLGDIDQAASLGKRVAELAGHTKSARATDRLRHVSSLLVPYQASPTVREFFESYSSVNDH